MAPYADVIEGLGSGDQADLFRRNAVDELFTFEEAEAWVAYLQRHYSTRLILGGSGRYGRRSE